MQARSPVSFLWLGDPNTSLVLVWAAMVVLSGGRVAVVLPLGGLDTGVEVVAESGVAGSELQADQEDGGCVGMLAEVGEGEALEEEVARGEGMEGVNEEGGGGVVGGGVEVLQMVMSNATLEEAVGGQCSQLGREEAEASGARSGARVRQSFVDVHRALRNGVLAALLNGKRELSSRFAVHFNLKVLGGVGHVQVDGGFERGESSGDG